MKVLDWFIIRYYINQYDISKMKKIFSCGLHIYSLRIPRGQQKCNCILYVMKKTIKNIQGNNFRINQFEIFFKLFFNDIQILFHLKKMQTFMEYIKSDYNSSLLKFSGKSKLPLAFRKLVNCLISVLLAIDSFSLRPLE